MSIVLKHYRFKEPGLEAKGAELLGSGKGKEKPLNLKQNPKYFLEKSLRLLK